MVKAMWFMFTGVGFVAYTLASVPSAGFKTARMGWLV